MSYARTCPWEQRLPLSDRRHVTSKFQKIKRIGKNFALLKKFAYTLHEYTLYYPQTHIHKIVCLLQQYKIMNTNYDLPPPAYEDDRDTKKSLPERSEAIPSAPLLNESRSNSVVPGQQEININPSASNVQNLDIQNDSNTHQISNRRYRYDNNKSAAYNFSQEMTQCYNFRGRTCLYKWVCSIITLIAIFVIGFIILMIIANVTYTPYYDDRNYGNMTHGNYTRR